MCVLYQKAAGISQASLCYAQHSCHVFLGQGMKNYGKVLEDYECSPVIQCHQHSDQVQLHLGFGWQSQPSPVAPDGEHHVL